MNNKLSILAALLLLVFLISSIVSIVYSVYTEWLIVTSAVNYGGTDYQVIDAKGIGSTEYGSVGPYIYGMYYIYNQSSNHNYTLLRQYNSTGDLIQQLLLYSSAHVNVKPGELEVSPTSDYLAAVMYGSKSTGDSDGFIFLSDINITGFASLIYDGFDQDTNYTLIWDVYYAVDNEIFVGGAVLNESSGYYEGLIVVYSFNGTHLLYDRDAVYVNKTNDVFVTDLVIGPDGYLYATMYEPYYYNGEFYDYLGLLVKIDPVTLNSMDYVKVRLYNSFGYIQLATITGSVAADSTYLYLTFNRLSDQYGVNGYSGSILVAKLTTSLSTEWVKIIDDPDYDEYSYDIAVTSDNVTVMGITDNNYGSSDFQDYNGFTISLDPVSGSAKYGLLIGGLGYDQFKDPSITWDQKLYIIGVSDSTTFYELRIAGQNIPVSSIDKLYSKPIYGGVKPVRSGTPYSRLDRQVLEEILSIKERYYRGGVESPSRELKVVFRHREGCARFGVDNMLSIRRIDAKNGGEYKVEGSLTPGILLKISVDTGGQALPPKPVPENPLVVAITIITASVIAVIVYVRRR